MKVNPYLQLAYTAKVHGGLGSLTEIEGILTSKEVSKMCFTLGLDYQSTIYKFNLTQTITSCNIKISEVARELLKIQNAHMKIL